MNYSLFPTAVSFFKYKGITEQETKFLIEQKERGNTGNTTSVDTNILENKKMKELKKFIEKSVKEYFNNIYQPKYKVEPYITQSWCNYTKQGQFHHKHSHPNSFISGVFYVQADKTKDRIYFYKQENYITQRIDLPAKEYNIFNSASWWLPTNTNDLVLFPSHLVHMVREVVGKERISLSFNTFLKGHIGEDTDLSGLHL